jgi:hypothetical protein
VFLLPHLYLLSSYYVFLSDAGCFVFQLQFPAEVLLSDVSMSICLCSVHMSNNYKKMDWTASQTVICDSSECSGHFREPQVSSQIAFHHMQLCSILCSIPVFTGICQLISTLFVAFELFALLLLYLFLPVCTW